MTIDRSSLTIRRRLGAGGFGIVHEVDTPRGVTTEPTCAFKEFTKAGPDDIANLRVLVDFRRTLSDGDRATLDALATWPLELVESKRRVIGYLMRVVPTKFMEDSITQTSGTTVAMRSLDWLAKPDHARRSGAALVIDADDVVLRLAFCAQLARVIHFLHQRGVVIGDLSQINTLHSGSPAEIMLIDLDPARVTGRSPAIRQAHSPGMSPPECRSGQKEQDVFTDRFKMAILFYNMLGVRVQVDSRLSGLTGRVDHQGMRMFGEALGRDTRLRPHADAWYRYFYDQVIALSQPPTVAEFTVEPTRAMVGQSVEVSWRVSGHRSLTVETPWGEVRDIGMSGPRSVRVPLQRSGQFRLVASNPHGSVEADSDVVYAFDPPRVGFVEVPELGAVRGCVTGIHPDDLSDLADIATLGTGFSWVDTVLAVGASNEVDALEDMFRVVAGGALTDTGVLASVIAEATADAEPAILAAAWGPRRPPTPRKSVRRLTRDAVDWVRSPTPLRVVGTKAPRQ